MATRGPEKGYSGVNSAECLRHPLRFDLIKLRLLKLSIRRKKSLKLAIYLHSPLVAPQLLLFTPTLTLEGLDFNASAYDFTKLCRYIRQSGDWLVKLLGTRW